jgi:hypothetical protein
LIDDNDGDDVMVMMRRIVMMMMMMSMLMMYRCILMINSRMTFLNGKALYSNNDNGMHDSSLAINTATNIIIIIIFTTIMTK